MKGSLIMISAIKLHEYYKKCSKCVGISKHNGKIYYAISGEEGKKTNKIAEEIEKMITDKDVVRCFIDKTFTVLKPKDYRSNYYTLLEHYIYDCIYNSGKAVFVFPEYLGSRISFKKYMLDYRTWYNIANFSCVERKIIGTIGKQSIDITIGCRPCYKCLPAIMNVTYYDQFLNKVHSIHSSRIINTFTFTRIF